MDVKLKTCTGLRTNFIKMNILCVETADDIDQNIAFRIVELNPNERRLRARIWIGKPFRFQFTAMIVATIFRDVGDVSNGISVGGILVRRRDRRHV